MSLNKTHYTPQSINANQKPLIVNPLLDFGIFVFNFFLGNNVDAWFFKHFLVGDAPFQ